MAFKSKNIRAKVVRTTWSKLKSVVLVLFQNSLSGSLSLSHTHTLTHTHTHARVHYRYIHIKYSMSAAEELSCFDVESRSCHFLFLFLHTSTHIDVKDFVTWTCKPEGRTHTHTQKKGGGRNTRFSVNNYFVNNIRINTKNLPSPKDYF